jgi:cobalt/nickel transport system ATP-binding protein
MALIELSGISFGYDARATILEGIDLSLQDGDRVGLTGGNGTGKTTLLHLIMGLRTPLAGTICLFGKRCRDERDFKHARKRIGLVFQDSDDQLFCPTVLEDVAFGPLNLGLSHREARERAEVTLHDLGIAGLKDRVPFQLSGGEKRLVAMATVLAMKPEVLLLDEPTLGLDEAVTDTVLSLLMAYPAKAWILISHDRRILDALTDKRYRMEGGRLAQIR